VARREARYRSGNGGTERSEPTHSPPPCPYWGKGVRPKRGAKGIVNIGYNYLNLPNEINFGGGKKLTFVYDAMGRKLSKRVYDGTSVEERSYFGGIEYRNGQLERVATSAGSVTKQQTASVAFRYEYVLSDHLGNTRAVISDLDDNGLLSVGSEVIQVNHYYPYGLNMQGPWNGSAGSYKYQYNGKELTDALNLNWNDYGARYYDAARIQWTGVDPLAERLSFLSSYVYALNNPLKYIDPDGRIPVPPSTDVIKNEDGSYTVVNAHNDGDNNIYVVDCEGNRTGGIVGTTMKPYDFMSTNDQTGEFTFDKGLSGVTFCLDNLTVSGTVKPNEHTESTIYNADAQRLLDWGVILFDDEVKRKSPSTFYGSLEILKEMSANGSALDFKVSLGLPEYTAIKAGNTSDGNPIITTLRAIGNMTFGANMRSTKPYLLGSPTWYYSKVMEQVGAYNQSQNNGNGYNTGFPYFGEHTYSGSYIFYGFSGSFYK
jgi:RHS repeat-associated protein